MPCFSCLCYLLGKKEKKRKRNVIYIFISTDWITFINMKYSLKSIRWLPWFDSNSSSLFISVPTLYFVKKKKIVPLYQEVKSKELHFIFIFLSDVYNITDSYL
jgi:hypothetical protein